MPSSPAPTMESDSRRRVVRENYDAFVAKLAELLPEHRGKFALMRERAVVELFDTARDAYVAGKRLYADGAFSVQEVTDVPADLGSFSHAVPQH